MIFHLKVIFNSFWASNRHQFNSIKNTLPSRTHSTHPCIIMISTQMGILIQKQISLIQTLIKDSPTHFKIWVSSVTFTFKQIIYFRLDIWNIETVFFKSAINKKIHLLWRSNRWNQILGLMNIINKNKIRIILPKDIQHKTLKDNLNINQSYWESNNQ